MAQATFIIDPARRILLRDPEATRLLEHGDFVAEVDGVLVCRNPGSNHEFRGMVDALSASAARAVGAPRRQVALSGPAGSTAIVRLLELHAGPGQSASRVMVSIALPLPLEVEPELLAEAYDLTPAESRLAALIARGRSTSQCSSELGVKTSTLRSHLVSIYSKTRTAGKADLVRMVLTACAT